MHARVWRRTLRLPLLVVFAGVAVFIYLAENIGTWAGAWVYPDQAEMWQPVSPSKLGSWFLLMIISVVMVTWVYPTQRTANTARADDEGRMPKHPPLEEEQSQAPAAGA